MVTRYYILQVQNTVMLFNKTTQLKANKTEHTRLMEGLEIAELKLSSGFMLFKFSNKILIFFSLSQPEGLKRSIKPEIRFVRYANICVCWVTVTRVAVQQWHKMTVLLTMTTCSLHTRNTGLDISIFQVTTLTSL